MSKEKQIEVITYEEERLDYFTELMKKSQKRYKRLFKKFKDAPYLSEESVLLSDTGRQAQFHGDVVEMLEKGYRKQEWISVDERLPEETCECLTVSKFGTISLVNYSNRYKAFNAVDDYDDGDRWKFSDVTHWMPLPEAPKMKGGAG